MAISAKCGGLWDDSHAIMVLANYLSMSIYVWSKKHCVICLQAIEIFKKIVHYNYSTMMKYLIL
jgi:hypothetical protein